MKFTYHPHPMIRAAVQDPPFEADNILDAANHVTATWVGVVVHHVTDMSGHRLAVSGQDSMMFVLDEQGTIEPEDWGRLAHFHEHGVWPVGEMKDVPPMKTFNIHFAFDMSDTPPKKMLARTIEQAVDQYFIRHFLNVDAITDHKSVVFDVTGEPKLMAVVVEDGTDGPTHEDWNRTPRPTNATVTLQDLAAWILTQKDDHGEWGFTIEDAEGDTDAARQKEAEEWVEHFLLSCTDSFSEFLGSQGLSISDRVIEYDIERFPVISAVTRAVAEEYEDEDQWNTRDSVWRMFRLGGDDDVDYNGSYIDTIIDVLWAYHHRVQAEI